MFRGLRTLGNTIDSRFRQQSYFFIRWNSTIVQENDFEIKLNGKSEDVSVQKDFEQYFANVNDVSSLLQRVRSTHKINIAFKALDLLSDWCITRNIKFADVQQDENYKILVEVVGQQANSRPIYEIIKALKSLRKMGVPSKNFLIESLENDLLWNIRKLSINSLLKILAFQLEYKETEKQNEVIEQTIFTIEKRWTEVKNPHDLSFIYSLTSSFSPSFLHHIDDLSLELSEKMTISDLAKIFVAISNSKRRPTPVLRTLAYHMVKKSEKLSTQQISNILFAMNTLNFVEEMLLEKLSVDFLSQVEQVDQPYIIGAVAFCMGQMRWKEREILDALTKWVIKNIDICRCNDIVSLIITLATVNHIPYNIEELLSIGASKLDFNLISEKNVIVDFVWALIILGKATSEQISSVLQPEFIAKFPISDLSCVGSNLKLMNIRCAAEVLQKSYNGPALQFSDSDNLMITKSRKDMVLQSHIKKILHNFLPPPKYLRENVRTKYGFIIDAEIVVNEHCKPLDLTEFSLDLTNTSISNLPSGAHKIALMVWNFKDYTVGVSTLTGQNALVVKLLKELGYKVMEIPYYDINKKENTLKSIQYFERKIMETVEK